MTEPLPEEVHSRCCGMKYIKSIQCGRTGQTSPPPWQPAAMPYFTLFNVIFHNAHMLYAAAQGEGAVELQQEQWPHSLTASP